MVNSRQQFRLLFRQFLFRLMDVELLSASARGDASGLLGQCGALLISISVLLSWFAISVGAGMGRMGLPGPIWGVERFLVSLTMLAAGVFAILNWDTTFLDRRDAMALAPLPVRGSTLLAAKAAAALAALGLMVGALNSLSAFAWPIMLAPRGSGVIGTARFVGAFWVAPAAAGAFVYCGVLAVQGLAAQLPRRWYLRVSSLLQVGIFVLLAGALLLGSSLGAKAPAWMPQYWFLGLLSEVSGAFAKEGHAAMAPLARRAAAGLAGAAAAAGGAYLLSYFRTLRKIVEEPDLLPGARGGIRLPLWGRLPRLGNQPEAALAQFVIRTLLRSRQHRLILMFYVGGGFALTAVYLGGAQEALQLSGAAVVEKVNAPILAATAMMLCAAWLGARTVFSLPLDLRANWLFRVTPAPGREAVTAAARRALLASSTAPVAAASAALLAWRWPWAAMAQHLLTLGLFGSVLADLSLRGFHKIPFTCSCLPGKSKVHMVFWLGVIPVIIVIHKAAALELAALGTPVAFWAMAAGLGGAAFAARRIAAAGAEGGEAETRFEETAADEFLTLGLDR